MNWFRRLFGGRPRRPRIVITTDGEQLRVDADWPDTKSMSVEQINRLADGLVATVNILTRGDGTGLLLVQQAVSHTAKIRDEEQFGLHVVRTLNFLDAGASARAPADESRPAVGVWSFFPDGGRGQTT